MSIGFAFVDKHRRRGLGFSEKLVEWWYISQSPHAESGVVQIGQLVPASLFADGSSKQTRDKKLDFPSLSTSQTAWCPLVSMA